MEGYCSNSGRADGRLTLSSNSCSITENNLLGLGDILAIKSPRLGVDWIMRGKKRC